MIELRVMIVDDEPLAHRVLEDYCRKVEGLRVVGNCFDGLAAFNQLRTVATDLVLLDVEMPDLSGLDLLDSLAVNAPKVILTTAYTKYAVDSFEYDQVIDYLHKPVKLTRFIKAVRRVRKTIRLEGGEGTTEVKRPAAFLVLEINQCQIRLSLADILYVQAWGNYVRLYLKGGQQKTARKTLKWLENELPAGRFQRIHKSYIVQIDCVTSIELNEVVLEDVRLPMGKSYRQLARRGILGR